MQVLQKRELTKSVSKTTLKYEQQSFETIAWNDMNMKEREFSEAQSMRDKMC